MNCPARPPAVPSAPRRDSELEATAADWVVRRHSGELTPADCENLAAWLAASADHAAALAEMESHWRTLLEPRRLGHAGLVVAALDARSRRRRAFAWTGSGLAAAALALVLVLPLRSPPPDAPVAAASIARRPDLVALPDGSTVELNAGAELAVEFSVGVRRVRLRRGEALFDIARDPARPFVVDAGGVEVRAIGTAFSVRHGEGHIGVLVTHGRVSVERVPPGPDAAPIAAEPVVLEVGHRVAVPLAGAPAASVEIEALAPAAVAAALAWRERRVEFTATPLAEAIELFNRSSHQQLRVDDPALARRLVTGIFWADDVEGFARLVETGFGARAERHGDVIVLRSR